MYGIMLVEDDRALCSQLSEGLRKWNFDVWASEDFERVLEDFIRLKPRLVIMDINLPCFDGFYWCRKIREISNVPVVFLSSRDSNMDVVMAVSTGADDYIAKPFSMPVLIAKLQAVLRRAYDYSAASPELLEHRGVTLNTGEGILNYKGCRLELTKNELKILALLLNKKGCVVSRENIMQLLWDNDEFVNDNTLTVNIARLRSRLSEIGLGDLISTRKGQGYIIS